MGKTYFRRDKYEFEDIENKKYLNRKALRKNKNVIKELDECHDLIRFYTNNKNYVSDLDKINRGR